MSNDVVNHPSHYCDGRKVEPIQLFYTIGASTLVNALKYLTRIGRKEVGKEIQDLEKAKFYVKYEYDHPIFEADRNIDIDYVSGVLKDDWKLEESIAKAFLAICMYMKDQEREHLLLAITYIEKEIEERGNQNE